MAQEHPGGLTAALGRIPTASILGVLVGALCIFGLVMVGSASEFASLTTYGSSWAILIREGMWMAIGLVALAVAVRTDYRRWRRFGGILMVISFVLLLAVLVPGIGVHSGGSSRWIGFGQFRLQPSELMKLAMVLFGADLVIRREERGGGYRTIVGPLVLSGLAAAILILVQPDMGTALVIGCLTMALIFASGVPMGPILKILGGVAVTALLAGLADPYRRARLFSFLNPSAHASGSGYQVLQSLIGLGSGHLFGLGLGNGREKWGFLPNAHTDFIFSVVGEELGLVGTLLTLLLLGLLAWFGLRAATRAPDRFGALVGVGLVAWLSAETVVNLGAVIGVLPVTGIPLPFISFGGSSLVLTLVAAGILINIARQERRPTGVARRATVAAGTRR